MFFDFQTLPTRERYKLIVSTIVPRPVAWVVTQDADGINNAAPYSFFNALTDDPVVIAIGCGPTPEGSKKDTLQNIRNTGQFVVNLVSAENAEQMNVTAIQFSPEVDELKEAGLTATPSTLIKPPRILESPVALECETFQLIPVSHHTIVLGRVLAMHVRDDCVLDPAKNYINTEKLNLVGRMHGRGWYARTTDRIEIPRMTPEEWAAKQGK